MPVISSKPITAEITDLYAKLEQLLASYEELMDTDVRQSLHLTLEQFFVWGKELDRLPISYGMFSLSGDKSVASVVNSFLLSVSRLPELRDIPIGKERSDLLQNRAITTPNGRQYDEFIGHSDEPLPTDNLLTADVFEEGDYD